MKTIKYKEVWGKIEEKHGKLKKTQKRTDIGET